MFQIRFMGKGSFVRRTSGMPELRFLRRCLLARGDHLFAWGLLQYSRRRPLSEVACNTRAGRASLIGEPRRKDGFTNYGNGATDTTAERGHVGRPQRPLVLRLAAGRRLRGRPEGSALRHGPAAGPRADAGAGDGEPPASEGARALGAPRRGA